jgi:hypothetical protein
MLSRAQLGGTTLATPFCSSPKRPSIETVAERESSGQKCIERSPKLLSRGQSETEASRTSSATLFRAQPGGSTLATPFCSSPKRASIETVGKVREFGSKKCIERPPKLPDRGRVETEVVRPSSAPLFRTQLGCRTLATAFCSSLKRASIETVAKMRELGSKVH